VTKDKRDLDMILEDICPLCQGELDTGFECNDCGADHEPSLDHLYHYLLNPGLNDVG
jgi:hypothetical protein